MTRIILSLLLCLVGCAGAPVMAQCNLIRVVWQEGDTEFTSAGMACAIGAQDGRLQLLSAAHILANTPVGARQEIRVRGDWRPFAVIEEHWRQDVVCIETTAPPNARVYVLDDTELSAGDPVQIGHQTYTLSAGTLVSRNTAHGSVQVGDSGGPVFRHGKLVGIITNSTQCQCVMQRYCRGNRCYSGEPGVLLRSPLVPGLIAPVFPQSAPQSAAPRPAVQFTPIRELPLHLPTSTNPALQQYLADAEPTPATQPTPAVEALSREELKAEILCELAQQVPQVDVATLRKLIVAEVELRIPKPVDAAQLKQDVVSELTQRKVPVRILNPDKSVFSEDAERKAFEPIEIELLPPAQK